MTRMICASFASVLLSACAATPTAPAQEAPPPAPVAETATDAEKPSAAPAAAAVLTHEVADFAAWRVVFNEHAPARKKAGILGSHVNQSADNPNMVSVYIAANSAAEIQSFLADPELKSTMQRAGVVSAPSVTMLAPVEDFTVKDRPLAGAIVRHKVADFDVWKKAFDDHAAARVQAGVVGHAVNRVTDDASTVVIYLQTETLESLRQFAASEDLKATMIKAGVQGPPLIVFVQGATFGQ